MLGMSNAFGGGVVTPVSLWEVLMWFDSEAAARVLGAAETVDYFG